MNAGLEKAREASRRQREAGIIPVRLTPQQKLHEKPTRKHAIDAMCHECMGNEVGVMEMIRECSAPRCPLYQFRPYK